ncbi:hypothetical protein Pve01_94770 [Planomonospora venezuelensis]|nr:hypothetical protein Pve01_94770 [Planomonospora venezuelensis]
MAGRASHSPVKAAVYLLRAVFALCLALVRDWPAQLDDSAGASTAPTPQPSATSEPPRARGVTAPEDRATEQVEP